MATVAAFPAPSGALRGLSSLALGAGLAGMALSYLYLASAHQLDVIAGAAGFVAGAILVSGGLVSRTLLLRQPSIAADVETPDAFALPMDVGRWLRHFQRNRLHRPEPGWTAPIALPPQVIRPLVRSLEQFHLGDGGGPAYLIALDQDRFLEGSGGARALVDRWFDEEREHSRLLGAAVARFGGQPIAGHWSFSAFCLARRWFGVRFELTVLLLTEIASTVYYRLLRRHGQDQPLRAMCRLILRDENGHVAFHRDRLARVARAGQARYGKLWAAQFRLLGLGAATMLWINHAPALKALGATRREFYREVWHELTRFIRQLRRAARDGR